MREEDKIKLNELNQNVVSAIKERKEWLDSKMHEYAKVKIGEDIYDLSKCVRLGKVVGYYRFWADRDDGIRDGCLSIDYEYVRDNGCYDNTSSNLVSVGNKHDLIKRKESQLMALKNESKAI